MSTLLRRFVAAGCLVALTSVGGVACSSSSGSTHHGAASCGPILREALDQRSLQHVLPGSPTPSYLTDPPTSGPHQPSPPIEGFQRRPIPKPVQVGILEAGHVLVQYRGLGDRDVARLRALADKEVVVAPDPDLRPGQVVATGWIYKRTCSGVDRPGLQQFIDQRHGHGPSYHAEH